MKCKHPVCSSKCLQDEPIQTLTDAFKEAGIGLGMMTEEEIFSSLGIPLDKINSFKEVLNKNNVDQAIKEYIAITTPSYCYPSERYKRHFQPFHCCIEALGLKHRYRYLSKWHIPIREEWLVK